MLRLVLNHFFKIINQKITFILQYNVDFLVKPFKIVCRNSIFNTQRMNLKKTLLAISLISCHFLTIAQEGFNSIRTIDWGVSLHADQKNIFPLGSFDGCFFDNVNEQSIPVYFERINISDNRTRVRLKVLNSEELLISNSSVSVQTNINLKQYVTYSKGKPVLNIEFTPVYSQLGSKVVRVTSFNYEVYTETLNSSPKNT